MSSAKKIKDEQINLSLKHEVKLLLGRAASLEGQTVSKFVLNSALIRAKKAISEHEVIHLDAQDSEAFFNALAAPVQFNQKLAAALKEHDERGTSK